MEQRRNPAGENGRQEQAAGRNQHQNEAETARVAHQEADKDMEQDPDFAPGSPNDDLDEGETARLGEDIPGIF